MVQGLTVICGVWGARFDCYLWCVGCKVWLLFMVCGVQCLTVSCGVWGAMFDCYLWCVGCNVWLLFVVCMIQCLTGKGLGGAIFD